jgi:hypothetical protein
MSQTFSPDLFADGLIPVRTNLRGPEAVRCVNRDGLYVVEVHSAAIGQWIAQMETTDKRKAMTATEEWT